MIAVCFLRLISDEHSRELQFAEAWEPASFWGGRRLPASMLLSPVQLY